MVEDGISEHDFREALLNGSTTPMGTTFSGEKRMASGWSFFDNQRHSKERCWQRPCIVCDQPLARRSDPQDFSSCRNFAFFRVSPGLAFTLLIQRSTC